MTRKASNFNTLARKLGLVGCAKRWRPPGRAATMDAGANHGLYAALGLTFAAELDLDVVKKAYRKMSLKYHPVRAIIYGLHPHLGHGLIALRWLPRLTALRTCHATGS